MLNPKKTIVRCTLDNKFKKNIHLIIYFEFPNVYIKKAVCFLKQFKYNMKIHIFTMEFYVIS